MGETVFEITFNGTIKAFLKKMNEWQTTTTEGRRYSVKNPPQDAFLKLQRGVGFLTAPIIMEFYVKEETGDILEITIIGYVKAYLLIKSSLLADAKAGALPRRNGWRDMMKIFDHIGVDKYNHSFR